MCSNRFDRSLILCVFAILTANLFRLGKKMKFFFCFALDFS